MTFLRCRYIITIGGDDSHERGLTLSPTLARNIASFVADDIRHYVKKERCKTTAGIRNEPATGDAVYWGLTLDELLDFDIET